MLRSVFLKNGFAPIVGVLVVAVLLVGLSASLRITQKPLETKISAATQGEACSPAGARCINNWAWWCYTDSRGLDEGEHPCTCDNPSLPCWNEAPQSPPPSGDPNICETGGSTASVCYGRAVNSPCNGFPGACVRNGEGGVNGNAICGCYSGTTPAVTSAPQPTYPPPAPPNPTYTPPATSTPRPLLTSTPRPANTSTPIPLATRTPTAIPSPTRVPTPTIAPFATSTPRPGYMCPDVLTTSMRCRGVYTGMTIQPDCDPYGAGNQICVIGGNGYDCNCVNQAPDGAPVYRTPTATPTPQSTIGLRCGTGGITCRSDQYCGLTTGVCQWKHSTGKGCTRDVQCKSGQCNGWVFVNRVCK